MNRDVHERARKLALSGRVEELAADDRDWLEVHLAGCAACREYGEAVNRTLGAVRALGPTAGEALVRSTQRRVRQRAIELRARNAMMRPLWIASAMVVLTSAVLTPLLWQAFAWIGRAAQVSEAVWRTAFVLVWISPALAASFLLLGCGYVARWHEMRLSAGGEA